MTSGGDDSIQMGRIDLVGAHLHSPSLIPRGGRRRKRIHRRPNQVFEIAGIVVTFRPEHLPLEEIRGHQAHQYPRPVARVDIGTELAARLATLESLLDAFAKTVEDFVINDAGFLLRQQRLYMEEPHEVAIRLQDPERAVDRETKSLFQRQINHRLQVVLQRRNQGALIQYRAEDVVLGLEVVVKQALGGIEFERDVVHGRRGETLGREYLQSGPNDLRPRALRPAIAN